MRRRRESRSPSLVECALSRERAITAGLLVVVLLGCWTWIAAMAHDMYGAMEGASAWMMTDRWDLAHLALLGAMWIAMMTAMMLPSAAPLLVLYASSLRSRADPRAGRKIHAMAAGYLVAWAAFSIAATALQRALAHALLLTPMMEPARPAAAAALLALAALYQFTPQKLACLRRCRSPLSFLVRHDASGAGAAFRLGLRHGMYCLGCCWALMLLLFAGGVMNLLVIVALTAWVLIEKFAPLGEWTARAGGAALLALAAWLAFR